MLIETKELLPQYMQKIYAIILKGGFINENSSKNSNTEIYNAITTKESEIRAYFLPLGYILMHRSGYFYFAHDEASDKESALEKIVDYIDIVNFLKTVDNSFSIGYRFKLSSIENQLNSSIELQDLAKKMKGINSKSNREFVQKIVDKLKKDGFVEEVSTQNAEFIVLNSYDYIEMFLSEVEIYEEGV
ncbi:MAG: hypothetical protein U9P38_02375 [Campylobacterota bacterium]|nr:hypothetical protein [Campylobacterota bacterium]